MRLTRPRLTIRRLMILVALAELVLGGVALMQRRRDYALVRAFYHGERKSRWTISSWHGEFVLGELGRYHSRMFDKWRAAANRPWLPVEADPPEPE